MFSLERDLGTLIDLVDEFSGLARSTLGKSSSSRASTFAWKLRCILYHARDDEFLAFLKFNKFTVPYIREIVFVPKDTVAHVKQATRLQILAVKIQQQYCHLATRFQIQQIEALRQNAILELAARLHRRAHHPNVPALQIDCTGPRTDQIVIE